jgi:hypothetical protein
MTTTTTTQLPDVLGALTGGARAHFGVLQAALALRPPTVNAGRVLEAVLLVQNTCDQMVDLSVTLLPPEQDAKKQRGKFVARSPKLVVAVKPGEVGCVLLPVATLLDTAPGEYKLAVEIAVKSPERSRRVREAEGGGSFKPAMLSEAARPRFAELKPLSFSANKPVLRSTLEATFSIIPGRPVLPPELQASWLELWSFVDASDALVLARYAEAILIRGFPRLKRDVVYEPLLETTKARFAAAGFELRPSEAAVIAKLMTLLLEYAAPRENAHGYIAAGKYAIEPLVHSARKNPEAALTLPHWMRVYIRLVAQDERALNALERLVTKQLYLPLLRDAIEHAFALVSQTTGQIMGEQEEITLYSDRVIDCLEAEEGLDFQRVYLPLIMGGVLVNDKMLMVGEQQDYHVQELVTILLDRQHQIAAEDADVLDLAQETIHRVTKVYGNRGE